MLQGVLLYGCLLIGVLYWVVVDESHIKPLLIDSAGTHTVTLRGTVVQPVQHVHGKVVMIVEISTIERNGTFRPMASLLRLTWRGPDQTVLQGDHIEVTTRVHSPFGVSNPGGFDYRKYLTRKGIQAIAFVSGPGKVHIVRDVQEGRLSSVFHTVDRWRDRVRGAALASLDGKALGLYLGMIIGEQSFIASHIRDAFMITGTVHIISISGSHLGLLAFLSFFLTKSFVRRMPAHWIEQLSRHIIPERVAVIVTIPLVVFYTLLAGSEIATVRSLLMILLFLFGVWLGRKRDILWALGIAALAVAIHNPWALYDVSFQLSYGAVLAIALAIRWGSEHDREQTPNVMKRLGHWLGQYLRMGVAVTLATLPLVAYYFNHIAWIGLLTNLLVVPFVGIIAVPIGLLSAVGVLFTGWDVLPLRALNQRVFEGLAQLVSFLSHIPGVEWHVASPTLFSIALFYLIVLVVAWRWNKGHAQWAGVVILGLLLVWWGWAPRSFGNEGWLRVTFLDVGQGDATVLELPGGQTVLIDAGGAFERWDAGQSIVGPYLWDRGIRRIDHVIATHPQLDHVGGLLWIMKKFEVGHYWTNGVIRDAPFYQRLQDVIREARIQEQVIEKGQEIVASPFCRLSSLNPTVPRVASERVISGADLNNLSIVTRLDCGPHSFLFTADVERDALERLRHDPMMQDVHVVKIPHHGAKSSFYEPWIKEVGAEVAVASAGKKNRYGHPALNVLDAYERQNMAVFRTDVDGAIWITANLASSEKTIRTGKELQLVLIRPTNQTELQQLIAQEASNWGRLWSQWTGQI